MVVNFRVCRISRDTQDDPDTDIKKKKLKIFLLMPRWIIPPNSAWLEKQRLIKDTEEMMERNYV